MTPSNTEITLSLSRRVNHHPCGYQPWPKISRKQLRRFHVLTWNSPSGPCHHSCLALQEKGSLSTGNCPGLTWRGCAGWRKGETLQPSLPVLLWGWCLTHISVQDSRGRTFTPSLCSVATPPV